MSKGFKVGDVVQFNSEHKWSGCFGIVDEKEEKNGEYRYLISVPMPGSPSAFIFSDEHNKEFDYIGRSLYT